MPFKPGRYEYKGGANSTENKDGFTLVVEGNDIYISPEHPLSVRISEIFDADNWQEITGV